MHFKCSIFNFFSRRIFLCACYTNVLKIKNVLCWCCCSEDCWTCNIIPFFSVGILKLLQRTFVRRVLSRTSPTRWGCNLIFLVTNSFLALITGPDSKTVPLTFLHWLQTVLCPFETKLVLFCFRACFYTLSFLTSCLLCACQLLFVLWAKPPLLFQTVGI